MADANPRHWWNAASDAFDAWLTAQPDRIQGLGLLEQIDLYAVDTGCAQTPGALNG